MKTVILGAVAMMAGAAIMLAAIGVAPGPVSAGSSPTPTATPDPTSTPDPTPDPCDQFKKIPPTCVAVPTQPPRSEGQDTPTATATAAVTQVPGTPAATNTAGPPPATATPGGGAGAGGVSPPDTGSGPGGDSGVTFSWLALVGAAVAVAGGATLVSGVRRNR